MLLEEIMADFVKDDAVKGISIKLIEKLPDLLGHIKPGRLLFVREVSSSQKVQSGSCRAVKPPYNLLDPNIMYIICVYFRAGWDSMTEAQQVLLVMHQLMHIGPDFDGVLLQHDASDWSFLLDNFGADYLHRKEVPNLLTANVER